jgi:dipeptidyl aminopeptidase/acylaminoacyl peptidase
MRTDLRCAAALWQRGCSAKKVWDVAARREDRLRKWALALAAAGALLAGAHGAVAQTQPAAATAPATSGPARAPVDLYVRDDVFRSPDISPNGRYVVAVHREDVGDVVTVIDTQANHVSRVAVARADQQMKVAWVSFKSDDRLVFELEQRVHVVSDRNSAVQRTHVDDAYENDTRVYSSNIDGTDVKALYDPSTQQGLPRWVSAGVVDLMPNDPDNVLMIAPASGGAALWKVNVRTAEHTVIETGDFRTAGWIVDSQGTPVLREEVVANGRGLAWQRRGPGQRSWTEIIRFIGADNANSGPAFVGLGPATQPGQVFVLARRDGDDTRGLYVYDTATGRYTQTIGSNPNFDMSSPIRDPRHNAILAACWIEQKIKCTGIDPTFGHRWNGITHALGDDVNVILEGIGGADSSRYLIRSFGPQDLGTFYLYDANAHTMNALFGSQDDVDRALLPTEQVVNYAASDGTQLWGYLWVPPGVHSVHNLPLVVVPHGGPEGRDIWGDDAFAPWLASQGYAVFQPNFRGSSGSGRRFVEAGWRGWGTRMQEDVTDGAHYLIQQGIADPHRICIMGWSYGGYVAETAAFENADLYKCSVAGAGVSDMEAMLRWVRDGSTDDDVSTGGGAGGQSPVFKYWSDTMGNLGADHDYFVAHSAAQNADRVTIPLLLIHGDEDSVVPHVQSELMQQAMQRAGHPVRLITLVGENHTPVEDESYRTILRESQAFIQQYIGPGVVPGSQ